VPIWRGLFRVKGQDRAHVSDGDIGDVMARADYEAALISPPWDDLKEVDPDSGPPQPQRPLRRKS